MALAWAYLAAARSPLPEEEGTGVRVDRSQRTQDEARRARQMSAEMGET